MKFVLLSSLFLVLTVASAADAQQNVQQNAQQSAQWSYTYPVPYQNTRVFRSQIQADSNPQAKVYASSEEVSNFPAEARPFSAETSDQEQRNSGEAEGSRMEGEQIAAAPTAMAAKMAGSAVEMATSGAKMAESMSQSFAAKMAPMVNQMTSSINSMATPMVNQMATSVGNFAGITQVANSGMQRPAPNFSLLDLLAVPFIQVLKQMSPTVGNIAEMFYDKLKAIMAYFQETMARNVQSRMMEETGVQGRGLVDLALKTLDPIKFVRMGIKIFLNMIPNVTLACPQILVDLEHVDWVLLPIFLFETTVRIIAFFMGFYLPFVPRFVEVALSFGGFIKTPLILLLRALWPFVQPIVMKFVSSVMQMVIQKFAPKLINNLLS